jgi:hypothetical protein
VQVHPDDLPAVIRCLHWGLLFLVETDALHLPASAREREAPPLHRIKTAALTFLTCGDAICGEDLGMHPARAGDLRRL